MCKVISIANRKGGVGKTTSTNLSKEVFEAISDTYGDYIKVFKNKITVSTKIAEAPSQGVSIFTYNPNSEVAKSYELLAREVLNNE